MKMVHTKWFPFGDFICINLFGILFYKSQTLSEITINHERIHSEQGKELLWIPFYIIYFVEWLVRLVIDYKNAYETISFEREAYANQYFDDYYKKRKHFSWLFWWKNK